jgi:hypothetical protein
MKSLSLLFVCMLLLSLVFSGCDTAPLATEVDSTVEAADDALALSKADIDCDARPNHPKCQTGGDDLRCDARFNLEIVAGGALSSDDGTPYVHGSQRVMVGTGKNGDGWRFDTNQINKLESHNQIRTMKIDFSGVTQAVKDTLRMVGEHFKGIDMRFQPDALNLCQVLESDTAPSGVTIGLRFTTPNTDSFWKDWGAIARYGATGCIGDGAADPVYVTRTSDSTWTFVGTTACLERDYTNDQFLSEVFSLPFTFHLTRQ